MSGSAHTETGDAADAGSSRDRGGETANRDGGQQGDAAVLSGELLLVYAVPLLAMAAMLNFAPLLPLIRDEFALSNVLAGSLASATILSHTLLQLPGGQIAHWLGLKRAIALGLGLMGLSVMASGLSSDYPVLMAWRFLLGAGTATVFISGLAYASGLVSPGNRLKAQGAYGAGANVGTLLVLLLSERAASLVGWRGSFVLEGVVILLFAWVFIARLPSQAKRDPGPSESWGSTLRRGPLYLLGLAHILTYGTFMAAATWVATLLWQKHGVGLEWAGPLAALLAASAVVGRLVGAAASRGRERRMIVAGCLTTAVGVGLVPALPSMELVLIALVLLGGFAAMPFAANFTYMSLLSERGDSVSVGI